MADITISLVTPSAANGATVTGYTIYRSLTSGGSQTTISTNVSLPYVDTGRTAGTTYFYRVAGVNSAGTGAQSAEVSAIAAGSPTVSISAAQSKNEGNSGANVFTYTVTRSSAIGATSVPWSLTAGSTTAGDFTGGVYPTGGSVALADGVASGTFTVSVAGDTTVEADETFTVLISTPTGYTAGASTSATGTILNDDVAGGGATFTMTQLAAASRVYQRSTSTGGGQGKGAGTIPVTLNVTAAGTIYARARSANDGTTIVQASFLAVSSAPVANASVNIPGIDARLGWFFLDLSPDGVIWTNGTMRVGMGRVVATSGQSLAVRMFGRMDSQSATNASLGVTPSTNSSVYATYIDGQRTVSTPSWAIPADATDYDSTYCSEFLRLEVAAAGVNCGLVGHSKGAQAIAAFISGGSEVAQLRANLDAVGGFEAFHWLQGHSDAAGGTTSAAYQASLSTLFADMAAHNAVLGTGFGKVIVTIPNINSASWGSSAQIQTIRSAAETWSLANGAQNILMGDVDLIDGAHQSQAGSITLARHFYRADRPSLGLAHNDNGPSITSATRAAGSLNIVLALSMPSGATALSSIGAPKNRFSVFPAGTITGAVALDATTPVTLGSNTITLKLATLPADSVGYDIYAYYPPDPSNAGATDNIYDNNTDADGITTGRELRPSLTFARSAVLPNVIISGAITQSEGNSGAVLYTFTVTRSATSGAVSVPWSFSAGTTDATDFTGGVLPSSGSVALADGVASGTFSVSVNGDTTAESNETFTVTIAAPTGYSLGSPFSAAGTITNDDAGTLPRPALSGTLTYVAAATGFGSARTGGTAYDPVTAGYLSGRTTITMEGRIKIASSGGTAVAFGQGQSSWIGVNSSGRLIVNINSNDYINGSSPGTAGTNPVITDNAWHHVAIVCTPTTQTLYFDGVNIGSNAFGKTNTAADHGFTIGDLWNGGGYGWPGQVDEIALWSTARYTANFTPPTAPYVGNESGLIGLFHLDGNTVDSGQ